MKKGLYIAIIVVLAVALVGSAVYLGSYFWEGKKSEDEYDKLRQDTLASTPATTEASNDTTEDYVPDPKELEEPEETFPLNRDYKAFYEKNNNKDFVGWLRIDGTKLDYPVMQSPISEANYYLYRDYNGDNSTRGSIYAREECDVFTPGDNVTMYGHNMKDGSMFAALNAYVNKSAWDNNSLVFFDTFNHETGEVQYHVYKIFSVFKTTANLGEGFTYQRFENAANQQEFDEFVSNCKKLSFYDTGITPQYGDKMICLSTCEYTLDNGRLVVAAVRIS